MTHIRVTLTIFNFNTGFLAQIVENRETRLSRQFLGPRDNFSKIYYEIFFRKIITKTDLPYKTAGEIPRRPKNGLERRPPCFSTICAKN